MRPIPELSASTRSPEESLWLVRGGERGQAEALNLLEGVTSIGWAELHDLAGCTSIEQVRDLYREAYPDDSDSRVNTQARQPFLG
jgi:predicted Mrr-cat superfamily restriction endonuclease